MESERLLGQRDAAEILGVKPRTLELWRHRRIGPRYVRIGSRARYRPSDLAAFISERVVNPERPRCAE